MSRLSTSLLVASITAMSLVGCAQPSDTAVGTGSAGGTVMSDAELQARQDLIGDVLSDALPADFMMSLQMTAATQQLEFTVSSYTARPEAELQAVSDALVDVLHANFSAEELYGFDVAASVSTVPGGIDLQVGRVSLDEPV
jgi:hypothetical protein